MNAYRKSNRIGPGGVRCKCCNPMFSHKHKSSKVLLNRVSRRTFKHHIKTSGVLNQDVTYLYVDEDIVGLIEDNLEDNKSR